ncbi:MAG: flagellar basal body rod protein FlgB [Methylococcales bacterium]|jgi:flagellar basal-body rod protein FlgB|nr:flagellar basal body rod protein FlgB [Methylococcales bacterium]
MAINFDTALGIHPQALALREKRGEQLAANLANADTPGYKARDLDFQSILKQSMPSNVLLDKTQPAHFSPTESVLGASLQYRIPNQASLDGNTVESHVEQAKYAENNVQYQASLRFINGRFNDLKTAIKGQ